MAVDMALRAKSTATYTHLKASITSAMKLPLWRRGGMDLFAIGSILSEIVPFFVLVFTLLPTTPRWFWAVWGLFTAGLLISCNRMAQGSMFSGILLPMYFLSFMFFFLLPGSYSWLVLVLFTTKLLMMTKVGICMSVALHRYAAHEAFKCHWTFSLVLGWIGCLATQGGPVWWASKHICHHRFCDTPEDPHSPLHLGVIWACDWFGIDENKQIDLGNFPNHLKKAGLPMIVLDSFAFVPAVVELSLAYYYLGITGLYVSYISNSLCKSCSIWFNITNHPAPIESAVIGKCYSKDHVDKPATASPHILFAWIESMSHFAQIIGEATHDHHHDYAQLAHRPGGVDLPYYLFVRPLEMMGIIWDVQTMETLNAAGNANQLTGQTAGSHHDTNTAITMPSFTMDEVAMHNTDTDAWVVVSGGVYNVTAFLAEHPGGKKVLLREVGKDATRRFLDMHGPTTLANHGPRLKIGTVTVS
jgi:fatty-acid desaturase